MKLLVSRVGKTVFKLAAVVMLFAAVGLFISPVGGWNALKNSNLTFFVKKFDNSCSEWNCTQEATRNVTYVKQPGGSRTVYPVCDVHHDVAPRSPTLRAVIYLLGAFATFSCTMFGLGQLSFDIDRKAGATFSAQQDAWRKFGYASFFLLFAPNVALWVTAILTYMT